MFVHVHMHVVKIVRICFLVPKRLVYPIDLMSEEIEILKTYNVKPRARTRDKGHYWAPSILILCIKQRE